ncbi:UNVERIFIED_CONTAM: hypothetical protein FKN15_065722 [Acipenser sinensis]
MNLKFQAKDVNQTKTFQELEMFVKHLMQEIVNPIFISRTTDLMDSDWKSHIMHNDACQLGASFALALTENPVPHDVLAEIKERCKSFIVTAVEQVLQRLPGNTVYRSYDTCACFRLRLWQNTHSATCVLRSQTSSSNDWDT